MQNALRTYLSERPSDTLDIISMQKNSLTFFPTTDIPNDATGQIISDTVITMPTKMSVVEGYDFTKDYNHVLSDLKAKLVDQHTADAQKIMLQTPEIGGVLIKVSPPWSDTLPSIKSRIRFSVDQE